MSRLPRESRLENTRTLEAHRAATDANPVTEAEAAAWMRSLSGLDDAIGKGEQLRVCRDLLRHAPEDEMLGSDRTIVKRAIEQLEEELRREPLTNRRHTRRDGGVVPVDVCAEDGECTDDYESYEDTVHNYD